MDTIKNVSGIKGNGSRDESHVGDAANKLLNEGKKLANELYEDGAKKVALAEDSVKEYTGELLFKVKQNPLTSVCVAAGVGFLLSLLLRK